MNAFNNQTKLLVLSADCRHCESVSGFDFNYEMTRVKHVRFNPSVVKFPVDEGVYLSLSFLSYGSFSFLQFNIHLPFVRVRH